MTPNADEFKAIATGDPIVKEKIMVDGQLGKLEAQRAAFWGKRQSAQYRASLFAFNVPQLKIDALFRMANALPGWIVQRLDVVPTERELC